MEISIHRPNLRAAQSLKRLREQYGAVFVAQVVGITANPDINELETAYLLAVESYHSLRPCLPQPSVVLTVPGTTRGRVALRQASYPSLIPGIRYLFVTDGGVWNHPFTRTHSEPFAWFRIAHDRLVPAADAWSWTPIVAELEGRALTDAISRLEAAAPVKGPTATCEGRR